MLAALLASASLPALAQQRKSAANAAPEVVATDMHIVRRTARELARTYGGAEKVLVVYDVDNTLLTTTTALGSNQWYEWQAEALKTGSNESVAGKDFECLIGAMELLYATRPMRLTHESVYWSVEALRDEGFTQWVITSRAPELAAVTFRELDRQRLMFSPFFGKTRTDPLDLQLAGRASRMQDGVMFTAGGNKGDALNTALRLTGKSGEIRAIVFVDDSPWHLPNMRQAFADTRIEVHTFLYEASKPDVDAFNAKDSPTRAEAKKQWCELAKDIPAIERSFSPDIVDLRHEHSNNPRHMLSACVVNVCEATK